MTADPTIAAAIGALILFALWLRTNIALGILTLTAGYVLTSLISDEIISWVYTSSLRDTQISVSSVVAVVVTLLPSLAVIIRFKGFQPGRVVVHIASAVSYALLAAYLVITQLPFEVQNDLRTNSVIFDQLETFEVLVALGAIILAIFDLMAHEKKLRKRQKRKHKKSSD